MGSQPFALAASTTLAADHNGIAAEVAISALPVRVPIPSPPAPPAPPTRTPPPPRPPSPPVPTPNAWVMTPLVLCRSGPVAVAAGAARSAEAEESRAAAVAAAAAEALKEAGPGAAPAAAAAAAGEGSACAAGTTAAAGTDGGAVLGELVCRSVAAAAAEAAVADQAAGAAGTTLTALGGPGHKCVGQVLLSAAADPREALYCPRVERRQLCPGSGTKRPPCWPQPSAAVRVPTVLPVKRPVGVDRVSLLSWCLLSPWCFAWSRY